MFACLPRTTDLHTPLDLAHATLLRNPWQQWAPWFSAAGLTIAEPTLGPAYLDSGLILQAACSGEGVALGRELLVGDDLKAGRLVRPFDVEITDVYGYYLVRFEQNHASKKNVDTFAHWLSCELGN
jgi:LysR family glycine cleavage system transcriptional activator